MGFFSFAAHRKHMWGLIQVDQMHWITRGLTFTVRINEMGMIIYWKKEPNKAPILADCATYLRITKTS